MVCSVLCSISSMEFTGADAGEFAGAGAVCNVHCVVCSVLPATDENLAFKTVQLISYIKKIYIYYQYKSISNVILRNTSFQVQDI